VKVYIAFLVCFCVFVVIGSRVTAEIPDWFTNPPVDPNYLYATGTGTSMDLQLAIDIARHNALVAMASQKQIAVSGQLKLLEAEAGANTAEAVSKTAASGILRGCIVVKQWVEKEDKLFRAYVLMEMPVKGVYAELIQEIEANGDLLNLCKGTQWFKDMKMGRWREQTPKNVKLVSKLATSWGQMKKGSCYSMEAEFP
jgi:hypothetical protein